MPVGIYKHKPHSKETKRKISKANKGKKHTKESKQKISKRLLSYYRNHPERNPNWKGGKLKHQAGYIYIHQPKHPYCENRGYIRKSRLVVEKYIGRYLKPEEVVHHINGIINDDHPENLYLFSSNSEHRKYHGNQYMKNKGRLKSNLKQIKKIPADKSWE